MSCDHECLCPVTMGVVVSCDHECLLFQVIGLLLLGLGIWVVTASQHYESINDAPMSPAILAIVVGVCMLLTAFCGIIGALKDKLLLLKIVSIRCLSCSLLLNKFRNVWLHIDCVSY